MKAKKVAILSCIGLLGFVVPAAEAATISIPGTSCQATTTRTLVTINFETYSRFRTSSSQVTCRYVSVNASGIFRTQNRTSGVSGTISATADRLGNVLASTSSDHTVCTGTNFTGSCATVTLP
jgi:hypothetical protein